MSGYSRVTKLASAFSVAIVLSSFSYGPSLNNANIVSEPESPIEFISRSQNGLKQILDKKDKGTLVIVVAHSATLAAIQFNPNSDKVWDKYAIDIEAGIPIELGSCVYPCASQFCNNYFLDRNEIFMRHGQTAVDNAIQSPAYPLLVSEYNRLRNVFSSTNLLGISYNPKKHNSLTFKGNSYHSIRIVSSTDVRASDTACILQQCLVKNFHGKYSC